MEAGKEISFTKPTLKFCIAGMFIPGFTAIVIFGLQQAIQVLGVACSISWRILWTLTTIGAIVLPIIFYNTLCYVSDGQNGLELVFTAWIALPILIILSRAFDFWL